MSIRIIVTGAVAAAALSACRFDDAGLGIPVHEVDAAIGHPTADAREAAIDAREPDARQPLPPDASKCPPTYTLDPVTGTAYRFGTLSLQWTSAEGDCEFDGPGIHLAVIEDETERAHLADLVGNNQVWVGVTDRIDEDRFRWVTGGDATFLPWKKNEPNDSAPGGEDCVELDKGQYNDESCTIVIQRYVCECDGVALDYDAF
jgi:hypothetical protein